MEPNIDPTEPQPDRSPTSDADGNILIIGSPVFKFSPPHALYALAYTGVNNRRNNPDIEFRLQRLERGQKVVRRGRIVSSVPQFRSQGVLSQTSANNPFTTHTTGGISYPSNQVPDIVAPSINNSNIKYPDRT